MCGLAAALTLLAALAPPAAAAPARLGTSLTAPVVDSRAGRVVWQPSAGALRVLDLGAGVPARTIGLPHACQPLGPGALRGDRLVLACADGGRLLDVSSGTAGAVPGAATAGIGGPGTGVLTVGRVWAEGFTPAATVFFALDGSAVERGDGRAGELPDLDAAELWRPLCAPLTRTLAEEDDDDPRRFRPYLYSPPLGLDRRAFDYRPLRVDRCGHSRPLRLSGCRHACVAVQLGAGAVAWRKRGRIHLFRGAGGRRWQWRARAFGRLPDPVPTRRHVVVTAGRYGAYSVWKVRAATSRPASSSGRCRRARCR